MTQRYDVIMDLYYRYRMFDEKLGARTSQLENFQRNARIWRSEFIFPLDQFGSSEDIRGAIEEGKEIFESQSDWVYSKATNGTDFGNAIFGDDAFRLILEGTNLNDLAAFPKLEIKNTRLIEKTSSGVKLVGDIKMSESLLNLRISPMSKYENSLTEGRKYFPALYIQCAEQADCIEFSGAESPRGNYIYLPFEDSPYAYQEIISLQYFMAQDAKERCDRGGDPIGCFTYGFARWQGTLMPKDLGKANAYLQRACNGNLERACSILN